MDRSHTVTESSTKEQASKASKAPALLCPCARPLRRPRLPYFLSTISEAPLLYMRKLSSGSLMTVLMDFRTELKV